MGVDGFMLGMLGNYYYQFCLIKLCQMNIVFFMDVWNVDKLVVVVKKGEMIFMMVKVMNVVGQLVSNVMVKILCGDVLMCVGSVYIINNVDDIILSNIQFFGMVMYLLGMVDKYMYV